MNEPQNPPWTPAEVEALKGFALGRKALRVTRQHAELVAALEAFSGDIADCECDIDLAASIQEGANASSAFGKCRHAVARSLLARVRGEEIQG